MEVLPDYLQSLEELDGINMLYSRSNKTGNIDVRFFERDIIAGGRDVDELCRNIFYYKLNQFDSHGPSSSEKIRNFRMNNENCKACKVPLESLTSYFNFKNFIKNLK